jgi:hypothetical protein
MARPLVALCALLVAACSTESPSIESRTAPPSGSAAASPDIRLHTEPVTRVRFPVPAAGISVLERHHDPTLPPHKFRHSIHLTTPSGTGVFIDVWDNPQHLALRPWFDAHLAFLVRGDTQVSELSATRARVAGLLLHQPRSPQALSQAIAVFASGEQVFRVMGIDYDEDPVVRRLFDQVIDQMELGVTP